MNQIDWVDLDIHDQLMSDLLVYGTARWIQLGDGTVQRIDPMTDNFFKEKLWDKRNDHKSKRIRHRNRRSKPN